MWVLFNWNTLRSRFFNNADDARKELNLPGEENEDMLTVDDYIQEVLGNVTRGQLSRHIQEKNYGSIKSHLVSLRHLRDEVDDIIDHVEEVLNETKGGQNVGSVL